jgi:CheY-like chemotaxis protein/HPt (histidine-containing phosphotransfer) domain-containing protein
MLDPTALLPEFRVEAEEHLHAVEDQLLALERDPADPRPIRELFLSTHTLKGGAAMLGLDVVRDLAHAMEDVFGRLRDRREPLDPPTADMLLRTLDALRRLIEQAAPGEDQPADDEVVALTEALRQRAGESAHALAGETTPALPPAARALLVEESATVRLMESMLLTEAGFQVDGVRNGNEALRSALAQTYDLVVTGLELRGLRGLDLAAILRASFTPDQLPIILMSSDADEAHRREAANLGIQAYIRKGTLGQQRLVEAAREALGLRSSGTPGAASGGHAARPRVLVVDDSAFGRRVARGILEELDCIVDAATGGAEALDALRQVHYAMILMDCQMPMMDGYETTAAIRRQEGTARHTPIVALTGGATSADREACFAAGMDDYLVKPVSPAEVQAVLARWLAAGSRATVPEATAPAAPAAAVSAPRQEEAAVDLDAIRTLKEFLDDSDGEVTAGLVQLFLDETAARLDRLRAALGQQDLGEVALVAYALKGSAATLGARELQALAGRLEQVSKAGSLENAATAIEANEDAFSRATPLLSAFLSPTQPA